MNRRKTQAIPSDDPQIDADQCNEQTVINHFGCAEKRSFFMGSLYRRPKIRIAF
jgi:hypothetical protein